MYYINIMKGIDIVLESLFIIMLLISTVAVFAFVILALLGFVKRDAAKGKKQFKKAGISFALMIIAIIGFAATTDPVESTDESDKEQVDKAKAEKETAEEKSEVSSKESAAKEAEAEEKESAAKEAEAKAKEVAAKEAEAKAKEAAAKEAKAKAAVKTPEDRITAFINKELGKETNNDKDRIVSVGYNADRFAIVLNADSNLTTNLTRTSMLMDASEIFAELQKYDDINGDVTLAFMLNLVDQYGNTEAGRVMNIRLTQETLDKINFESFNNNNYSNIADAYFEHPAISKKK